MTSFDPDIHVPGLWRCARCNFVLVQSNLNAADGTVTARNDAGDRCPNDDAPLWRVTWREHAQDMAQRCEEAIDEARQKEAAIAELVAAYYRMEIGRLMHQAEHWATHGKPKAVHRRVTAADCYFQVVALMERSPDQGWKPPFQEMREALETSVGSPAGTYPPTPEIHAYRDPAYVVGALNAALAGNAALEAGNPDPREEAPMPDGATDADRHNRACEDFILLVVKPLIEAGAAPTDLLVALESMIVSVFMTIVRLGGDEPVVDALCDGVKKCLAEIRLSDIQPGGRA